MTRCPLCDAPVPPGPFGGAICAECRAAEETQLLDTFKARHPYSPLPNLTRPEGTQ